MSFVKVSEENTGSKKVVHVSLNRPEVRNAFHAEMITELTKVFSQLSSRQDIQFITLTGEGESFCAGADLQWMKSMVDYSLDENKKDSQELYEMFATMAQCAHPILAQVKGHVMGGGLGLLAVCDIVGADAETVFCFSEAKLGLVPAVISPFIVKKIGMSAAKELMLTARRFKADEARQSGLIHFSGTESEVNEFFNKTVKHLKTNGCEALHETKRLLCFLEEGSGDVREETVRVIAERRVSDEGQEGLKSFFEKRSPSWRES